MLSLYLSLSLGSTLEFYLRYNLSLNQVKKTGVPLVHVHLKPGSQNTQRQDWRYVGYKV